MSKVWVLTTCLIYEMNDSVQMERDTIMRTYVFKFISFCEVHT